MFKKEIKDVDDGYIVFKHGYVFMRWWHLWLIWTIGVLVIGIILGLETAKIIIHL